MARTRDRRPSSEAEGHQFPVQVNVHENPRVYEENELSAAEALVGINASPTTSHPNESLSAPLSASTTPTYLFAQAQATASEKPRAKRRGSATPNTWARGGRKRSHGKFVSAVAASREQEDRIDGLEDLTEEDGKTGEDLGGLPCEELSGPSTQIRSKSQTPAPQEQAQVPELEQQTKNEALEHDRSASITSPKGKRKRKRSKSVSVAASGQVDGMEDSTEDSTEVNGGEHIGTEGLSEPPSELQSPTPPMQVCMPERQTQNENGGPANPETATAVNGTSVRKSMPRNFDRVIFGRWKIKTWYYSPYPISSVEEENTSASTGPTRATSGVRGQLAKRGSTRGRPRAQNVQESHAPVEEPILWVCDRCFKYVQEGSMLELHSKFCNRMHPPGRKVYERGAHVIYEIDGAKDKLFCQNLSLFGKFFIDIKTLFYDCENFMFYVLTEGDRHQDHVIGFFSKEKISYDEYNLACIITFPPYQRMRYGMLMIEFSYELSRRAGKLGTPERPLSELGLRTYLTFWTGALVQFFRRVLSVQPLSDIPRDKQRPVDDDLIRFIEAQEANGSRKRRKGGKVIGDNSGRNKIWESGLENEYNNRDAIAATNGANDALYARMRWMRTSTNLDGSATTHVFARCTLEDISNATGIRTEDVAFTLHECGLLQRIQTLDSEEMEEVIVISREMVEHVALEFKVKSKMCMEVQYCKF